MAVQGPTAAQASSRGPIAINGDHDLCDVVTNGADIDDGIVNCSTADGSAGAPFIIEGHSITLGACAALSATCGPPPCASSSTSAAIAICNTRSHILVRHVSVINDATVQDPARPSAYVAGVALVAAANVVLDSVEVRSAGVGLWIGPATRGDPPAWSSTGLMARNSTFRGAASIGGSDSGAADARILVAERADLVLEDVVVDASRRALGSEFLSHHDPGAAPHQLRILRSVFRNADDDGVLIEGYDASIVDSHFLRNGITPHSNVENVANVGNANLVLRSGTFTVLNNTFDSISIGVQVGRSALRLQRNLFTSPGADLSQASPTALFQDVGECSTVRFSYNDLDAHRVVNDDLTCAIEANHNYWGQGSGPESWQLAGRGSVVADTYLQLPVSLLPSVRVVAPASGTSVYARELVFGTTDPRDAPSALTRVEATTTEDDWLQNETAAGIDPWELTIDATTRPLGDLGVWIRACWSTGCGAPALLKLIVVERPLPPIALLDATPRTARVGDDIVLDAARSYSPQGRALASYRFELGNGAGTDWRPDSRHVVRYLEPGDYPVSVEVVDVAGFASTNLPQVLVHVRAPLDSAPGAQLVPGLSAWIVLVALAVLVRRRQ